MRPSSRAGRHRGALLACALALIGAPLSAQQNPSLSLAPHHSNFRDVTQGAANITYTTPAYISRDQPRSATLLFSSAQAQPKIFFQLDATDTNASPPDRYSLRVRRGEWPDSWQTFTNGSTELFFQGGSGTARLAGQIDAAALPSAGYGFVAVVRSWRAGAIIGESQISLRVPVINERESRYGTGWSVVGLQKLLDQGDGVFITEGDGQGRFFAGTRSGGYTSPAGDFSTIAFNGVGWTRTYPDGTQAIFGWSGYLDLVQDRFGNQTQYGYDISVNPHRIIWIQDPAGKRINFGYASAGALAWIQDPAGRSVSIDAYRGVPWRFTEPGGVIALELDLDIDNPTGPWLNGYWTRGVGSSTGSLGAWHFTYDSFGKMASLQAPQVSTTDAGLTRPTTLYTSLEKAVLPPTGMGSSTSPAPRVLPANVRVQVTDPRGNVTKLALDRFGAATRIEEPLGRTSVIAIDTLGRVTQQTSPAGAVTTYTWSGMDLTKVTNQTTGAVVNYEYSSGTNCPRPSSYHEPCHVSGNTSKQWIYYNSLGLPDSIRADTITHPVSKYTYAPDGRLQIAKDPQQHGRRYNFESAGLQNTSTEIVLDTANMWVFSTSYTRDGVGRVTAAQPSVGGTRQIYYNASKAEQVDSTSDGNGNKTRYKYHASGALWQVIDSRNLTYTFTYNALGWLTADEAPSTSGPKSRAYAYDRNGNQTASTNRRGQTLNATYDALNRILMRTTPEGQTTTWSYASGASSDRWVKVVQGTLRDSLAYDVAGRLSKVVTTRGGNVYTLDHWYNAWDQRDSLRVTSTVAGVGPWTTRWRYNPLRQVDQITDRAGLQTSLTYDKDGFLTERALPQSDVLKSTMTAMHRPGSVLRNVFSDSLSESYVESGARLTTRVRYKNYGTLIVRNVRSYSYDSADRLSGYVDKDSTQDCRTGTCAYSSQLLDSRNYSWDATGNPLGGTVKAGTNLVTAYGNTMTYDDDGNLKTKTQSYPSLNQSLTWNSLGQLVDASTNAVLALFRYDGLGRWAQYEQGSSGSTDYIYDGDHLLFERDAAGAVTEYTYYPGTDRPHTLRRGSSVYYYMTDHPGSVVALLDGTRAITNRYTYDPFGNRSSARESVPNPLQYQARMYEPSSRLYNFRSRWYDPDMGRFISEDPIGLAGGINPYVFAGNNPVDGRDPSGLSSEGAQCDPFKGPEACFYVELPGITNSRDLTPDQICLLYNYCGAPVPTGMPACLEGCRGSSGATRASGGWTGTGAGGSWAGPPNDLPLGTPLFDPLDVIPIGALGDLSAKGIRLGLRAPERYFAGVSLSELEAVLTAKYGVPKSIRATAKTWFDSVTGRSYNVHFDELHRGGLPHVDIRRRGGFPERNYFLRY